MLLAIFLWSLGGILIKKIAWHPLAIAGARSVIALPVLLIIVRPSHFKFSRAGLVSVIAYTGTLILFVTATKLTTAANVIMLQYTAPIYVAILAGLFLKERPTRFDWVAIVISQVGVVLFFLDDLSLGGLWGNILGILCGIFFAVLIVSLRKQKNNFPLAYVFIGNILTAVICLPFMFEPLPDSASLIYLIILGVFQVGLAYVFYTSAIRYIMAVEATLIQVVEVVLNPLWVFIFIGEKPGLLSFIGGFIIIAAVVTRSLLNNFWRTSSL